MQQQEYYRTAQDIANYEKAIKELDDVKVYEQKMKKKKTKVYTFTQKGLTITCKSKEKLNEYIKHINAKI